MSDFAKLIRLFLVNGNPDGIKTMEISNMTVKATIFPRPLLKDFAVREEAQKPGVYLLYSEPEDDLNKPILYIGEGDPVYQRLKTHGVKKDFWTEAFVFTSKDGYLTKTQIQYLESRLIGLAKDSGRVQLDNIQVSTEPTISEVDRAEVQQFLESIKILLSSLRLRFFEALSKSPDVKFISNDRVFEYKVKGYFGKMVIKDGQYLLLSGSMAKAKHLPSANRAICKLREYLIENGALQGVNENTLEVIKQSGNMSSP